MAVQGEGEGRGVVQTCAEQHIAGRWVPGNDAHSLGVPLQHHHRLRQRGD